MKKINKVILVCTVCLNRNYQSLKNKPNIRLELKKHCSHCNLHTLHKETR